MGLAQIPFIINFAFSWKYGRKVSDNPWEATTLEWHAPSPPPHGNFIDARSRLSRAVRVQRAGRSHRLHPAGRQPPLTAKPVKISGPAPEEERSIGFPPLT